MASKCERTKYFPMWSSWVNDTKMLTPEEKGRLIDALVYYFRGEPREELLIGNEAFLYPVMAGQIDRHVGQVIDDAENGRRGGQRAHKNDGDDNKGTGVDPPEGGSTSDSVSSIKSDSYSQPPPTTTVKEWAQEHGVDGFVVDQFLTAMRTRSWKDAHGQPIANWQTYLVAMSARLKMGQSVQNTAGFYEMRGYSDQDYADMGTSENQLARLAAGESADDVLGREAQAAKGGGETNEVP